MLLNRSDERTNSARSIIAQWHSKESAKDDRLAYYSRRRIFSAEFYTNGKIRWVDSAGSIERLLNDDKIDYILVHGPEYRILPEVVRSRFVKLSGYVPTRLNLEMLKRR